MKFLRPAFVLNSLLILASCTNRPHNARISIADPEFVKSEKIALAHDVENINGDHLWAQQALSQAFIENGWQVVERFRLEDLFRETSMDESGISKSFSLDSSESVPDSARFRGMNLNQLKRFGEMFNVNYLGFYGFRYGTQLYLRIVECQTGKLVALASFEGNWNLTVPLERTRIADLLVKSALRAAVDSKQTGKRQYALRIYGTSQDFPQAKAIATYVIPDRPNDKKAGLVAVSSLEEYQPEAQAKINPAIPISLIGGVLLTMFIVSR